MENKKKICGHTHNDKEFLKFVNVETNNKAKNRLHIDDGSMGGGGPIPHHDYITLGQHDPNPPHDTDPDFYDDFKNNGYFDNNRNGIFHYCIFCHYCWGDGGSGFKEIRVGAAPNRLDDDFLVCKDQSKYTFMHELGHNLGLEHSMESNGTFNYPDDYSTKKDAKKTVMYYTSAEATGGYTYDKLWKYVDLSGSI